MANNYFRFKQFTILQNDPVFKVGTDGVLLGACADLANAQNILDIGTGTGLIAIMAAQRSKAHITAIEPDRESFVQASENIMACKWNERIRIINTDFSKFRQAYGEKFDVIVSNPPWFRQSLLNPDPQKALSRHTVSLDSDEILTGTVELLSPGGSLQVILPYAEGSLFIAEASAHGLFCTGLIKVKPNPRGTVKRLILKLEKERGPVSEKFLVIETGVRHHYTDEYREITRDFYLGF